MKRILVNCPNSDDATSFYRGVGPLARLQKEIPDLSLVFVNEIKWSTVAMADVMFMQRPFLPTHITAAQIAKNCRVPLWIDYDDDLFAVPADNPAFAVYGADQTKKQVAQLCQMADVVTVSTEALAARIRPLNANVLVIPNALDDWIFNYRSARQTPRNKCVLWRGSNTHQRDLANVTKQFVEAANSPAAEPWTFTFVGYNPWWLTERIPEKKAVVCPPMDVMEYMAFLEGLHPALMVVPLSDHPFNRSKSNIAYLEGVFAGAAVIAPDMPEWNRPGVLLYRSADEFGERLQSALEGKHDLEALNHLAWEHVRRNETLSERNLLRSDLLHTLFARYRSKNGFQ